MPQPVGSQLSVFLHKYWPMLLDWLTSLFNKPTPAPAAVAAVAAGGLDIILSMIESVISAIIMSPTFTAERLTIELGCIDYVVKDVIPTLSLPTIVSTVLLTGIANIRATIQAQLDALNTPVPA